MIRRIVGGIFGVIILVTGSFAAEPQKQKDELQPAQEDLKVIEVLDILELMEVVKHMEMLKKLNMDTKDRDDDKKK